MGIKQKIVIPLLMLIFTYTVSLAQTAGINYQALILDTENIQVPGRDISQEKIPLLLENVRFRFSITGDPNTDNFVFHYVEEQATTTDGNGLVSLIVGEGVPVQSTFDSIVWDGLPKYLNVEIDIVKNGDGYVFLDSQKILYLPQSIGNGTITASNGLQKNQRTITLGGVLTQPTTIQTSSVNTLSLAGLEMGDLLEDRLVVIDQASGTLKQTAAPSLVQKRQVLVVADEGQTRFTPPLPVENAEKIGVYRNGIRITFTVLDNATIQLESGIVCQQDDEIRIVHFY